MAKSVLGFMPSTLSDLRAKTEYEAWLLQAVYEIIDEPLSAADDQFIYPPSGGSPRMRFSSSGVCAIGDWRPGFLKVGAPLVLVTSFKLLDMFMEWILVQNGFRVPNKFKQKIRILKSPVNFPDPIQTRDWLKERLIGLYKTLEPLRGSIIHSHCFRSTDGGIEMISSRTRAFGPIVIIPKDLRNLAVLLYTLLQYVQKTWVIDHLRELRTRLILDELVHLHSKPLLNQRPPMFIAVRVYVKNGRTIQCDLERIRLDLANRFPNHDIVFDVLIVSVGVDGSGATAYLIPWDKIQAAGPILNKRTSEIATFSTLLPGDLDLKAIAMDLKTRQ